MKKNVNVNKIDFGLILWIISYFYLNYNPGIWIQSNANDE